MHISPMSKSRILISIREDRLRVDGLESISPIGTTSVSPTASTKWLEASPASLNTLEHPWDTAHRAVAKLTAESGLEAASLNAYAEPDFLQEFAYQRETDWTESGLEAAGSTCQVRETDPTWPSGPQFAWHLSNDYSSLKTARDEILAQPINARVRIAHLDTGYDPGHFTTPGHIDLTAARNFTDDGDPHDATDPARAGFMRNPGHGTATLALLAGAKFRRGPFDDYLGGAPFAEIVPVRIATSVVHFYTSAMARGILHAVEAGCQIVSISMGGVPSRAWADAVNSAYESGVSIFAAAGNRIGPLPPSKIVYPARFQRVVAVCGVTSAGKPYYLPGLHRNMHGCFGPLSKMSSAIAACTPNMPWADIGCENLVNPDGAGTSSATPQVAAAAAIWLQQNSQTPVVPWRRVEAIRHALFSTAFLPDESKRIYFGNGLLRAHAALHAEPLANLEMTPADSVSFPWLRMAGGLEAAEMPTSEGREAMWEVESLQIFEQRADLQAIVDQADPHSDVLSKVERQRLFKKMAGSPGISNALRTRLNDLSISLH